MNLLLDTHILLWSLLEPGRLGTRIATELEDRQNTLWLSPITTWEICVLADKGRIVLQPDAGTWLRELFRTVPFKQAPLNHEVAIRSRAIPLPHQDPADRFLAASAMVHDLTLVTEDARLRQVPGLAVLSSRQGE